MLIVVSLLLLVGPFYRGLFFTPELLVANIIIFALLFVWGLYRLMHQEVGFAGSLLDLCLLVLLLSYLVSFLGFAVNKREALEELLKIASYIVIYLVVLDICRHWPLKPFKKISPAGSAELVEEKEEKSELPPGLNLVLHIILAAATLITVASLGVPAGHWDFIGAYAANRIASPMGYANTAAAYFMATYFLALGLAPLSQKKYKIVYLVPAVLMLIAVILTFSRGAWLLLPPLFILLVVASAPAFRLRAALYSAATIVAALPGAFLADAFFQSDQPAAAWLPIMGAVALTLLLGVAAEYFLHLKKASKKKVALAFTALIVVFAAVFVSLSLVKPVSLETKADQPEKLQALKQVVKRIEPETSYQLIMEVQATEVDAHLAAEDFAWGIKVIQDLPDYRSKELLAHYGRQTKGWETFSFDFSTKAEASRLSVELFNRYPGTKVTARAVRLLAGGQEQGLNFVVNRLLPERFYNRVFSFSRDRNMDRRFELFVDAFKVIKDYPLFGLGGGGWAAVYKSYQAQAYDSREVHNHFLQVWVEAGLLGFLAFTGLWVSMAFAFLKQCLIKKAPPVICQYQLAVLMPVAALGAHSAIDWNFSMAAVGIFLFALLGAGRSLEDSPGLAKKEKVKERSWKKLTPGLVATVLGLAIFIYTLVLYSGLKATMYSQEQIERGNIKQALPAMERAMVLDPYRADNFHNYNVLIEEQVVRTQNQAEFNKMLDLAKRAWELEPYNPNYVARYGSLLFSYVDVDEGLSYIDRVIDLRPHYETGYRQSALFRLSLVEHLLENNLPLEARQYEEELQALEKRTKDGFGSTKPVVFALGRLAYLQGKNSEALRYLEEVGEKNPDYAEAQETIALIGGAFD